MSDVKSFFDFLLFFFFSSIRGWLFFDVLLNDLVDFLFLEKNEKIRYKFKFREFLKFLEFKVEFLKIFKKKNKLLSRKKIFFA